MEERFGGFSSKDRREWGEQLDLVDFVSSLWIDISECAVWARIEKPVELDTEFSDCFPCPSDSFLRAIKCR